MTCLPPRSRKEDKSVAVTLLVICEREIKKITKPPVQRRNVTDKVLEALTSTDVLDKIMPVLTQKITETIVSVIESSIQSCVDNNIKPLIETVRSQQKTITEQQEVIDGHSKQLTEQSDKINKLEQKV